ncbi:DUF2092 domain-containing protein [Dinghuibacter silviterrae]|uniref:DUF2092 domain-containing protein n=1 Tax=Dinghuibacter silviterrae TaxID=1539049 RepID=A0A4R8DSQ5_9BACT|nr:DUF2092 domain-containing protein [Dinghuibacter silviterrae]TDX01304.1 hypothetical protein EDB95_2337 [Dinghuibacter silviterrae]
MNKKILLFVLLSTGAWVGTQAQSRRIDTVAVAILDKMSATIGDLGSCSVNVNANYDVVSRELGLIKHSDEEQVYLHGPNKLLVRSEGDKGTRSFFYDGTALTYYSMDKNQYGQIPLSVGVVEMMDTVNKRYGIDFPVADFFYPTFVDDILSDAKSLVYLGMTKVGNEECFHIAGVAKDKTFQFWIRHDAFFLPAKVVIVYTEGGQNRQFEATLNDWQVNPNLPDAIFSFTPPPSASKIALVALGNRAPRKVSRTGTGKK